MRRLILNDLVETAGLDAGRVKVLRHQEANTDTGRTSWELWQDDRKQFELHQSLYDRTDPIGDSQHIISLLTPSSGKTVFVGVWSVSGRRSCPSDVVDPLICRSRAHQYDLQKHDLLRDYSGRMVVDWTLGRAWHRRLSTVNIGVLEIHEEGWDVQPFPGFTNFTILVSEAAKIPATWREVLRAVRGRASLPAALQPRSQPDRDGLRQAQSAPAQSRRAIRRSSVGRHRAHPQNLRTTGVQKLLRRRRL